MQDRSGTPVERTWGRAFRQVLIGGVTAGVIALVALRRDRGITVTRDGIVSLGDNPAPATT